MFIDFALKSSSRKSIAFGDNNQGNAMGLDKVAITSGKHINNVMLVQSLGYNLMSVLKLIDRRYVVLFTKTSCIL